MNSQLKAFRNLASVYFFSYLFPSALSSLLLFIFIFFLFLAMHHSLWTLQFPDLGSNPCPLHQLRGVLTTGLPAKSLNFLLLNPPRPLSQSWALHVLLSRPEHLPIVPRLQGSGPLAELSSNSSWPYGWSVCLPEVVGSCAKASGSG